MMAWIESHQSLGRHYKTKRLARLLGVTPAAAIGHLHFLWWWCLDYAPDGCLEHCTREDIAEAAELVCDAASGIEALVQAGFLDDRDGVLHVHDWWEYAGKLIGRREQNAKRMRDARAQNVQRTCSVGAELPTNSNQPTVTNRAARAREASNGATPESPAPTAPTIQHDVDTREADRTARLHANGCTDEEIAWACSELSRRNTGWHPAPYLQAMIEGHRADIARPSAQHKPRNDPTERAIQAKLAEREVVP